MWKIGAWGEWVFWAEPRHQRPIGAKSLILNVDLLHEVVQALPRQVRVTARGALMM